MILSKKVRLRPTPEQEKQLWHSSGASRWAFNWTLSKQEENRNKGGRFISDYTLRKELTQLKRQDDYAWLNEVSADVTRQAVKDACNAYKRMLNGWSGKPKFKSSKRSKPSFYSRYDKFKARGFTVFLEKVGWVKTSEELPRLERYMSPRVTYDGKYWYVSFSYEAELEKHKLTGEVIGIDVGIKELAVCSNGMVFKNINKTSIIKKNAKRLRRLHRKASRMYEMNKNGNEYKKTENIKKLEKVMKVLYRRLRNIRTNHVHQATNAIVKTKPSVVVMEKLNVKGMMKNKHLSKALAEQKLSEFIEYIQYKCKRYGIQFKQAERWFPSSKVCSCCGEIKSVLKLSERTFKCDCGLVIDRDLNAAINLSKLAA